MIQIADTKEQLDDPCGYLAATNGNFSDYRSSSGPIAMKNFSNSILAERVGFEPTDRVSPVKSLAVTPIRPLSHLSRTFCGQFPVAWEP